MTYGDPRLPERIWDNSITVPFTGCWLWLGATDRKGYGKVWYKGKTRRLHRLVKTFRRTADHTLKIHSANEWYHAWHMIFPDSHFDDYMVFCDFLIKEIK